MQTQTGAGTDSGVAHPSPWVCHYTLSLLTIIYALNYLDRNIFSIILQSIKKELVVSDTALGLAVARVRMRAMATALFLFCGDMIGQTLGPLGIGYVNDALTPSFGEHAIRCSLLLGPASGIPAFILIGIGSRYAVRDIGNAAG